MKKTSPIWPCMLLVCLLLSTEFHHVFGQCISPIVQPLCSPPSSVPLVNNDVVAAGNVKTVNSSSSFTNLTMSGGTLIICGSLTVSNLTFNSGTIIINPGASMQVNMAVAIVMGANSNIYNFGSFSSTSSIVTGANNIIYNCNTTSQFNIPFNQIVIQGPNTSFINNGVVNSSYFIVQSNNSGTPICSGPGSNINTNIFINQYPNAFGSPSGPSCIFIGSTIINSQQVTNTSNVNVCYVAAAVSIIGSPNFGAATVNSSCASCSVALPVELVSFSAHCKDPGMQVALQWTTASELSNHYFVVERSDNAVDWSSIGRVEGMGNSNTLTHYSFTDENISGANYYYRLRQVDFNGMWEFYNPVYAGCTGYGDIPRVYPNPGSSEVYVILPQHVHGLYALSICDMNGKEVYAFPGNTQEGIKTLVNVSEWPNGIYLAELEHEGSVYPFKMVIAH